MRTPTQILLPLLLLAGCTRSVHFQVYDEDAACWQSTTEDRPALYWLTTTWTPSSSA